MKEERIKKSDKVKKYKNIQKKNIEPVINILSNYYKDAKCSLNFNTPFELVVALILAAQCTDARVNEITPILFKKYKSVKDIASADVLDIENIVKPCGFYKNKAKSIVSSAQIITNNFDGKVPDNMQDLCKLSGIGRKSSNIILQECFNTTVGIAVDTHVTRISRKIGMSNSNNALAIEEDLKNKIDKKYWSIINHILVYHGRAICIARKPQCDICPIASLCMRND